MMDFLTFIRIPLAVIFAMFVAFLMTFGAGNLEFTKECAPRAWRTIGYEPVGYEGYQFGFSFGAYGGAHVWHALRAVPDNGVRYTGAVQRWGEECHVYGPIATDAIIVTRR